MSVQGAGCGAADCGTAASILATEKCCDANKPLTAKTPGSSSFFLQVVEDKDEPSDSIQPVAFQPSRFRYLKSKASQLKCR